MKILFLAEAVSLAHVGRPFVLAKWAHENGIEVHFACSKNGLKNTKADSIGFTTYPLHTIDSNLFYERVNQGKFFYNTKELKAYIIEEMSLILKIQPDLIVSDFRLTSAISAELTGKQLLNLSNSYWSPNYACPFPAPQSGIFKLFSNPTSDFIFNIIRPIAFKTFGKELNQIRECFGLKKKNDFRELYTAGTYTAYMDLPNFVNIDQLPENHFFLGPIIWSPKTGSKSYSLSEKNNIYISMGNTGNNNLLPQIIQSVLKNNLNIIMSGVSLKEKEILLKTIPELKGKSILEPLIHAEEIFPYCKLTICHGGSGTVYQSVSNGVPILCFPKNPDQGLVSLSVTQNNIGRTLSSKNTNLSTIEKMIQECIANEVMHQNAINTQKELHQWDTKKHWAQFINKFKTIRKTNKIIA
jgi:UDP:flavonoid glycosyltransferase YjiC (YdhE family)